MTNAHITSEPIHARASAHSATARVVEQLTLYGYHAGDEEPDPRPLPDTAALDDVVVGLFAALSEPLTDTRMERDLTDLMWSLTDVFHRKVSRVQRLLDDNEDRQRAAQAQQDGSEIRSVDLEHLIERGHALIENRNAFEYLRDRAAEHFESMTGSAWRPRPRFHCRQAYRRNRNTRAQRRQDRLLRRYRVQRSRPHLEGSGQNPHQISRHGSSARWHTARCGAHRRLLGRQSQGHADRFQARLDPGRQGRAVQAQRPNAGHPADRRRPLRRVRHHRQSRRQSEKARYPSLRSP
jgi:hypothetical protein